MSPAVSADTRLARADPAVPGIAEVLDPLALVQRLAPGWGAVAARIAYLRYKPGTSLVAGLVLTGDDGATGVAQAFALGPDPEDKLAKVVLAGEADDVGRGAVVDRHAGVGVTDATADRHLRGVVRFRRSIAAGDVVTALVYKPGRRWVARWDRPEGPLLVKVHRPGELPGLGAGYRVLRGLPVSRATKVRERRGLVLSSWVPGTALDTLTGAGTADLWARAGRVLAQIHRQPTTEVLQRVDPAAALTAAVEAVQAVAPELADEAGDVASRVRAGLAGGGQVHVVHGDFSADQVIVRPDHAAPAAPSAPAAHLSAPETDPGQPAVTVVDLDRVGLGEPVADLASWYGAGVAAGGVPGDPSTALAPLLSGYVTAGGPADLDRLRLHAAAAVLQRATEPFRRHADDWPRQVARLVAHAAELTA